MGSGAVTRFLLVFAALLAALPVQAQVIIAHRGASGDRPEHTLAAYELAIEQGADYIEPDLVPTKDGVLVARHENEISGTTDVADHPEFADRRTTKTIDGVEVTGWFTEDFTLAELKTLRARERLPDIRPANAEYDGQFEIPTLAEIIALARAKEAETGRLIGLYPEIKHGTYFDALGFAPVDALLAALESAGYTADDPVYIQSFEPTALAQVMFRGRELGVDYARVQLLAAEGGPADAPQLTYAQFLSDPGLAQMARYASAIGVEASLLVSPGGTPTDLAQRAKAAGLDVHAWTARAENAFLPDALRSGDDPAAAGNFAMLWALLRRAGADAIFTDNVAEAVAARQAVRN